MREAELVERLEDMSPDGRLRLIRQSDGDIIVVVIPPSKDGYLDSSAIPVSAEFCTHGGGGQSPRTLQALYTLYEAMEQDCKDPLDLQKGGTTH
jgi:hypothetical protein